MLLRWRAPELTLLLADRALAAAQDDKMAGLHADHLAVFALNRLGRHGEAAHRLIPSIQDADTPQALRHELNVELAHCAAALGEPATALVAVRAVLAAGDDVAPALRGRALVAMAEASVVLGRDDLVSSALEEADELYREDQGLDHDTALLLRTAVRATDAARHRARGANEEAEAKAREGRELLAGLADPDQDSGEAGARLMLELALILLDRGAGETAMQEVRPLLRRQVRAAAAGVLGRLRLALATQVHLAEGRHEPALTLLADAVEGAQRYGVDAVLAECLEGLSHVHEARGEFADALHCMRAARAAEGRHRREVAAARSVLLEHCGSARREETRLTGQVAELLANAGVGCGGMDADSGEMDTAETDTADAETAAGETEVEVAETAEEEVGEEQLAPASAPAAASISLAGSTVTVFAAMSPEPIDPPAAVPPEPQEQHAVVLQDADTSGGPDPWHSRARHSRGEAGTLVSVSDLLPPSALSTGRSGRRRAEQSAGESADERFVAEARQFDDDGSAEGGDSSRQGTDGPDSSAGPPPAPTPRELEWGPDTDPADNDETLQLGLGDLLAEALAAYQESRDVNPDTRATGTLSNDAADAVTLRDLPRYRGAGTRWTAGLALAPNPIDENVSEPGLSDDEPSEVITNPLLRLPDLTAEPRWTPPETGRRSAAGD